MKYGPYRRREPKIADERFTPRVAQVAALLCKGYANKEISAELGISATALKHHITAIKKATGSDTRTLAALKLLRAA